MGVTRFDITWSNVERLKFFLLSGACVEVAVRLLDGFNGVSLIVHHKRTSYTHFMAFY